MNSLMIGIRHIVNTGVVYEITMIVLMTANNVER